MLEMIMMVRAIIGDISDSQQFDDERVQTALVVAALQVSREISLSRNYDFDIFGGQISPDPFSVKDFDLVALTTLKAACILNQNQYQNAISSGIMVREGSSMVDTTGSFSGYKDILANGPCAAYQKLLARLTLLQSQLGVARAVTRVHYITDTRYWFDSYFQTLIPTPNNEGYGTDRNPRIS